MEFYTEFEVNPKKGGKNEMKTSKRSFWWKYNIDGRFYFFNKFQEAIFISLKLQRKGKLFRVSL